MGESAKGWADETAVEPRCPCTQCTERRAKRKPGVLYGYRITFGAPSLNPTEAEVQAEEDMLP